jgi:hypothetical protein
VDLPPSISPQNWVIGEGVEECKDFLRAACSYCDREIRDEANFGFKRTRRIYLN